MKRLLPLLLTFSLALLASHSIANETDTAIHEGKALQQQSCHQCHDDGIYTRRDSIIFSLTALDKRVRFCEPMASAHWSEPQRKNVIDYLNQRFYHFKK